MPWTDLSGVFTFGSKLTSVQMQNLRDNLTAITDGSSGAPKIISAANYPYTLGDAYSVKVINRVESTAQNSSNQQYMFAAYMDRDIYGLSLAWSVGVQSWGTGATVWTQIFVNSAAVGAVNSFGDAVGGSGSITDSVTSLSTGDLVQIVGYTDRVASVGLLSFSSGSESITYPSDINLTPS